MIIFARSVRILTVWYPDIRWINFGRAKLIVIQEPVFSILVLVARIFLSAVFLVSGIHKMIWYTKAVDEFREAGVPLIQLSLPATIALHIVASICILCGIYTQEAVLGLAVFTVLATLWVFPFWQHTGPARLEQSRVAMANLGLVGGLLMLAVSGPGRFAFS